jgi:dipeptidyl aminopeptidase/acylaminoacyl peptidase
LKTRRQAVAKARAVFISIWVSALLALSPLPAPAWFADTHLYSNLQWSPDGTKIFYEDRFVTGLDGGASDYDLRWARPEVRCVDVATGEVAGVVPGAIYINPAVTPVPIKIEKLYGFALCSAEAGLSPEAYSVAAIERARDALYISEDFTEFIFETAYSYEHDGHDVVLEDVSTGWRRVLVEGAEYGAVYLKKSHRLVYTLEEGEKGSESSFPGTYILDLKTGRKRRLGSFRWLGATADERRAMVWRSPGGRRYDDDRSVISISLAADGPEPKKLLEGPVRTYGLSPGGTKLLYEEEGRLRVVDSTTGESADLPKGYVGNAAWARDDKYLVFLLNDNIPSGCGVCVFDTDAREFAVFLEPSYEYAGYFSWSPSSRYLAFDAYNVDDPGRKLCLVDVEAGEEWSVQEGEAALFCWVGGSRFLYSGGGKLYVYDCEKKEGRVVYAWFSEGDYKVLTWISDSQLIFIEGYGYGHLHVLDVRTGAHRVLTPGNGCDFYFAEDGNLVFRARHMPPGYPDYWEFDFATGYAAPCQGPAQDVSPGSSSARGDVVFPSPDGGRVAVFEGGKLTLRDADGSNAVTLMEKGKGVNVGELAEAEPRGPAWSPAGDRVAWRREGYTNGPFTDIWVASRDGGDVRMLLKADTNFNYWIYGER